MNAQAKQVALWEKVKSTALQGDPDWPTAARLLAYGKDLDYSALLQRAEDVQPPGREKVLCSAGGAVASVRFEWRPSLANHFTGMFRKADYGLVRISSVSCPQAYSRMSFMPALLPMVALKFLRDGDAPSGNVLLSWKKSGQKENNVLAHGVSNHFTENVTYPFTQALKVLNKYSGFPTFTGLAEFASVTQEGRAEDSPRSPYVMVLLPPEALKKRAVGVTTSLVNQLRDLKVGDVLYDVYVVPEPVGRDKAILAMDLHSASVWRAGRLRMTSEFTSSHFGDRGLFFQHHLFEGDLKLRPEWQDRADTMLGAPFYVSRIEAGDVWDLGDSDDPEEALSPDSLPEEPREESQSQSLFPEECGDATTERLDEFCAASGSETPTPDSEAPVKTCPVTGETLEGGGRCPLLAALEAAPVTVFLSRGCEHGSEVVRLLSNVGWRFVEIAVEGLRARETMAGLAGSVTTPQVFFNDHHVGGVSELAAALRRLGDTETFFKELVNSTEPLILPADVLPSATPSYPSRLPNGTVRLGREELDYWSLEQRVAEDLDAYLARLRSSEARDAWRYLKSFFGPSASAKCFKAKHLVAVVQQLVESGSGSLEGAAVVSDLLHRNGFVRPAKGASATLPPIVRFSSKGGLTALRGKPRFCLQGQLPELGQPFNLLRSWPPWIAAGHAGSGNEALAPLELLMLLSAILADLVQAHTPLYGPSNLAAVSADPAFGQFCCAMCQLQHVELLDMTEPSERAAFTINLFNLGVLQGLIALGPPANARQMRGFFEGVRFQLGAGIYSLWDLEHGVLRSNRPAPGASAPPFAMRDVRLGAALPFAEPRALLALARGPELGSMRWFSARTLGAELDAAAEAWVAKDEHVRVAMTQREVTLPLAYRAYAADVGQGPAEVFKALLRHARGAKAEQLAKLAGLGEDVRLSFTPPSPPPSQAPPRKDCP